MSVDSQSGTVYWGEVGPDAGGEGPRGPRGYDEINQAKGPGNFGWPYFIGNNLAYADYDYATGAVGPLFDAAAPVNASPNNTGSSVLPPARSAFLWYPYGASAAFPELGEGGRTACAANAGTRVPMATAGHTTAGRSPACPGSVSTSARRRKMHQTKADMAALDCGATV
jgi:cytochrome c